MNCLIGDRVLTRRYFQRIRIRSEIQVVGFHAACLRVSAGVGVNGNEEVRLLLVGDGGASFQRDEGVILPAINHFGAQPGLQQFSQSLRNP